VNKHDTLEAALASREEEIFNYQVNIDNYARAIAKIKAEHAGKPGMSEFAANLSGLLESSKTEQLKAIIIRDVIADQLAELRPS